MFITLISALLVGVLAAERSPTQATLASVTLPRAVLADGKTLPAGTYEVRATADTPRPAVGQSPGGERWVEFVHNGTVASREVATVIAAADIAAVAKGARRRRSTPRASTC